MNKADKLRFKMVEDGSWRPDENKALLWQTGVMVISITDSHVMLGSCREPLGSQPRDEIVNKWLNEHIEWANESP